MLNIKKIPYIIHTFNHIQILIILFFIFNSWLKHLIFIIKNIWYLIVYILSKHQFHRNTACCRMHDRTPYECIFFQLFLDQHDPKFKLIRLYNIINFSVWFNHSTCPRIHGHLTLPQTYLILNSVAHSFIFMLKKYIALSVFII